MRMGSTGFLVERTPGKVKSLPRLALRVCVGLSEEMLFWWQVSVRPLKLRKLKESAPLKLHIGCGQVMIPGWVNIDIRPGADVVVDVRRGLPFADGSVDYIYSEHFMEHLAFEEGGKILREFARCLSERGTVRIAMPDLDYLVDRYGSDWRDQEWLSSPWYEFVSTRGRMINVAFRSWGHKYLYNEEDLRDQLSRAGFRKIERCEWSRSCHPDLAGLETRRDSKLIVEAEKGQRHQALDIPRPGAALHG
jgi:predicted SAM-dependent methyltransferase